MDFSQKLTSPQAAKKFIFDLCKNDLDFHFDDDIKDIFGRRFSELEISQLETRRDELFELLGDPFKYLIQIKK
jgi:hypothetical protein